jgi:hypothetical protein
MFRLKLTNWQLFLIFGNSFRFSIFGMLAGALLLMIVLQLTYNHIDPALHSRLAVVGAGVVAGLFVLACLGGFIGLAAVTDLTRRQRPRAG